LRGIDVVFRIVLSSGSFHYLKKLRRDSQLFQRLSKKIHELAVDPFPTDAKKVIGKEDNLMRIRVGNHRILYVVKVESNEIYISIIDKRSKAYRLFEILS